LYNEKITLIKMVAIAILIEVLAFLIAVLELSLDSSSSK
jgi:hypothetical protein